MSSWTEINGATITSIDNTRKVQYGSSGLLVENNSTGQSLGIGPQFLQINGTINIDPLNLTAVAPNPTPTELVLNNTLIVQDDDTAPNNIINIQAGLNGGVGTFFGIDYESTTNQDFTIQTTNSDTGGVLFKQFGSGATTTQSKIKQGIITCNNTANTNSITIDASNNNIVITDGTTTNTITKNGMSGTITNATNATNVGISSTSTNASYYPTFVSATTGNLPCKVDSDLTYNPYTNILSATNLYLGSGTTASTINSPAGMNFQYGGTNTFEVGSSGVLLDNITKLANTGDLTIQGWNGNGTTAGGVNIQSNDNLGTFPYQGIVSVNADTTYQAYLQGTINAGTPLGNQFGVSYIGFTCNGIGQNPILNGANSGVSTALTIQPSIIINNPSGNPTISGQNNTSATSLVVSTGVNTPLLTLSNLGQPTIVGQNTGNNSSIQVPYGFLDNITLSSSATGTITLTTSALYYQNIFTGNSANITLKLPSTTLQPNGAWLGICFAPNNTTARTMTIQNSGGTTISVLTSGTTAYSAGTSATSVRMVINGGNWYCF